MSAFAWWVAGWASTGCRHPHLVAWLVWALLVLVGSSIASGWAHLMPRWLAVAVHLGAANLPQAARAATAPRRPA